ncbi:CPBP family intramembrane metalloprotease [candidate division TA06 bacterium]|nr:CPBP family intramembrane metalloprotease [candidate division TA06 bacterium]
MKKYLLRIFILLLLFVQIASATTRDTLSAQINGTIKWITHKKSNYAVARSILLDVKKQLPDTAFGGKCFYALCLAYRGMCNHEATYYYATKALNNAKTWGDSALAFAIQGEALYNIGIYERAGLSLGNARVLALTNDEKYFKLFQYLDSVRIGGEEARDDEKTKPYLQKLFFIIKRAIFYIGDRYTWAYTIFNGNNWYFLINSMFLTACYLLFIKVKYKANILLNYAYNYYLLYFSILLLWNVIITNYLIYNGRIDYFTNWNDEMPMLSLCFSQLIFALAYVVFDYTKKWKIAKEIIQCIKDIPLVKQIKWAVIGIVIMVTIRIVLAVVKLYPIVLSSLFIKPGLFNTRYFIIYVIAITIAAPIFEEVFMRWLVYRSVRKVTNLWVGLLATTIIGLLLHGQTYSNISVFYLINLILISTVSSILVEKTGSILPSIIVHMFNNVISFI